MKIAINGFGRIGRTFLRTIMVDAKARKELEVCAINVGPQVEPAAVRYGFKYDSLMGMYQGSVDIKEHELVVDDHSIAIIKENNPRDCAWSKYAVEWVVDCSGCFTKGNLARGHIDTGAAHVLISAPAIGEDISIIPGINETLYDPRHHKIVSLGSCTTNALFPMIHVLDKAYGIQEAHALTVHAYTNTQRLLDTGESIARKTRAAAINIIPGSSGASEMIGKIFPHLQGKVDVAALRVPVPKVSIVEITASVGKRVTSDDVNVTFSQYAKKDLKKILAVSHDPVVSSDFNNSPYSVIVDSPLTRVNGSLVTISGWYDNEWGYSERLKDFLIFTKTLR